MLAATLSSPAVTQRFSRALATTVRPPALVLLEGELGTGKTTLVRAVAHALGIEAAVTSPLWPPPITMRS